MRITPSGVRRQNASPGPVLTPNIDEWIKDIAGKKGWHGAWAEVERWFMAERQYSDRTLRPRS
jgi:hypothetical protein